MIEHLRRRHRTDSGFTLIEVIVTVALLGVVSAAVAAAVIVIFRSQDGVVASTAESHDTRQIVSYLPLDIESGPSRADAYRATNGGAVGDSGSGCSEAGTENVLRIDVTDRRNDQVDKRIAYRLTASAEQARIDRYECTFDATNLVWIESSVLNVADYLDPDASPIAEASVVVNDSSLDPTDQEVESVSVRYVQRGDVETIRAAPREEQPFSNSGVCGTDPLEAARNIATFVEGDVILHGTTVKSSLFVGGTLEFHGGSVAQALPDLPESPIPSNVGLLAGSIDWAGSTGQLEVKPHHDVIIEDGNYLVTGDKITESSPGASPSIDVGGSATVIPPGTDRLVIPGEAFAELRACSDRLAGLPDSCNNGACAVHVDLPSGYGGTSTDASNTRLTLTDGKANAFNIDESNLLDLETIQIKFAPGDAPTTDTPLIINVRSTVGGTVDFEAPTLQGSGSNSVYVVWNFPNADAVNLLAGDELRGSILAPYATVTSQASIQGGVIARTFEMFGSSLNDVRSFQGTLDW
ncbi:prepilin-type N-terminal cleavage/methylation domain-containing protein/choice-of-anchor A domain-containing protein [Ilumatobacter fluminis]|uniref:Prepilin-type N-terminal cleavage/methylation domain-containing protein/choice-of-anchor A domain-containing protein n=1 Tax=Ilumatobacter fluminis TaxID=467091 RepID=A0A4R7I4G5_9ACTN|nr:collagen-binding domain-containing protein [Ilumatobacter fluminis]TDT18577.1 prepilin-type N-terminal cleavage/methylation domain-containing protein/choice-of-anchor A domain-containing protein [Ilumatobacter fluminis]